MIMRRWTVVVPLLAALAAPAGAEAQERFALGGDQVALYNLVGEIQVVGTPSGQVTVDLVRGGRDGGELRVEAGRVNGVQTLRVLYPGDRIVYGRSRWQGTTQMRVRDDGTWGGEGGAGRDRGTSVRISSRGRGLEAWADLRIGVPAGQQLDIHLGVGTIRAENVDGRIRLQTGSGSVEAQALAGHAVIRTGSGRVRVDGMAGPLVIGTGSGRVDVAAVSGDSVAIRTGSGNVTGEAIRAGELRVRTGSGRIQLRRSAARDVQINTGSGSVTAELLDPVDRLHVRTGSGAVRVGLAAGLDASLAVRTGSGSIHLDHPLRITQQGRRELRGVLGTGAGTIDISTGSGSVRLSRI
jgi:lia operon protein LiaG